MSVRAENLTLERCEGTGKLRFSSQTKAHVHCQRVQKANKKKGDRYPIHVYRCGEGRGGGESGCGGWHIGHDSTYRSRNGKYGELKRK